MIATRTSTLLVAALLMAAGSANAQSGIGGGGESSSGSHLTAGSCPSLTRLLECGASDVWSVLFRLHTTTTVTLAGDTVGQVNDGAGSRSVSSHRAAGTSSPGATGGR